MNIKTNTIKFSSYNAYWRIGSSEILFMKIYLITIILLATKSLAYSQGIELGYTRNYLSNSLCILYSKQINEKSTLYVGPKYHINNNNLINHDASGRIYYQLGFSDNFISSIGLIAGYKYTIFQTNETCKFSIFFDEEISRLRYRNNLIQYEYTDSMGREHFLFDYSRTKYIFSCQSNVGINSKLQIKSKLSLSLSLGLGIFTSLHKGALNFKSYASENKYSMLVGKNELIGLEGIPFTRISIVYSIIGKKHANGS